MTTTVEAVHCHLRTDPIIHGALDRGVLNVRQAARWLIEANEWDTTEEAVVSALRRYHPPENYDLETALHLLEASDFTARTGLATVTLPRIRENLLKIPKLSMALEPEDMLTVFSEQKTTDLIIEEKHIEDAIRILGDSPDIETQDDMALIEIQLAERSETASTAIALILNALEYHGIQPRSVFGTLPSLSILIPRKQFIETHNLVARLLSVGGTRPKPG